MLSIKIPGLVRVRTRTWTTPELTPPGIVPGAAYASGDAIGTVGWFDLPYQSGMLWEAEYNNHDDDGLAVDLFLYRESVAIDVADNAAFAYDQTARDVSKQIGSPLAFTVFKDYTGSQKSVLETAGKPFDLGKSRTMYYRAVARGALNIAANQFPTFRLTFLLDG